MHIRTPIEWLFGKADETATVVGGANPAEYWASSPATRRPVAQRITTDDLKGALTAGLKDFAAGRTDVVFLCLIYPVITLFIAGVTAHEGALPLLFPIASGFALLGPFAAVGLYEMSRRREITGHANWLDVFDVLRSPSIWSIVWLGLILVGLFLVWLMAARGIYGIIMGPRPPASAAAFLAALFTTAPGWAMIVIGVAIGAVFAAIALAISVVSFPLLLDRPVGLRTAMETSVEAVRLNPYPLAIWGLMVASGLVIGSLPFFLGLVVVLPISGHSTWHLYRRLVRH